LFRFNQTLNIQEETKMELQQALRKIHEATTGDLYDCDWNGGVWMPTAVETSDTLADFEAAAKNYAERGSIERGKIANFPFIYFGVVQTAKGQQRRPLSVIDLGEVRFAVYDDLTVYAD
jgi:hypothetical protein